jgi:mono/diheme cytochrome c family protein
MHPDPLTRFVKQYQPLCPPPSPQLEPNLMAIIARSPQRKQLGAIIALLTIATGIGASLVIRKLNSPAPQMAQQLTDRERAEIVSYLLEDWEIYDSETTPSLSQQWLEAITE